MPRLTAALLALCFVAACQSAPAPEPEPIVEPTPTPQAVEPIEEAIPQEEDAIAMATVRVGSLNVRKGPSTTEEVLASLKLGQRVALIRDEDGWSRIRLPDGRMGWVASRFLRRERASTCPPDRAFRMTKSPSPSFSDSSASGTVTVEATVNLSGTVISTKVIRNTTGDESLAALAEEEIKNARFEPPIRDCRPQQFIYVYSRAF